MTHEFALGVTTPQSHNPWDESRIPGGSSGGSAISIVTGMALASLGTDTRASIRVPAALSGTVGFRPTTGVVPVDRWLTLVVEPGRAGADGTQRARHRLADGRADGVRAGVSERAAGTGSRACTSPTARRSSTGAEPGVASLFDNALQSVTRAGGQVVRCHAPT